MCVTERKLKARASLHPATAPSVGQHHGCSVLMHLCTTDTVTAAPVRMVWSQLTYSPTLLVRRNENNNRVSCLAGSLVTEK